jgi:hypothetical protein
MSIQPRSNNTAGEIMKRAANFDALVATITPPISFINSDCLKKWVKALTLTHLKED